MNWRDEIEARRAAEKKAGQDAIRAHMIEIYDKFYPEGCVGLMDKFLDTLYTLHPEHWDFKIEFGEDAVKSVWYELQASTWDWKAAPEKPVIIAGGADVLRAKGLIK